MRQLIVIGIGGMVGAVMRFLLSGLIQNLSKNEAFPLGTLGVNVLGCFIIGILGGYSETLNAFSPELRAFLMIGLLGSFTTFSSFELETFNLLRNSQFLYAALNVGLQFIVGLIAVVAGYYLSIQTR